MRFVKQTFTTDVTLDYNEFVDCKIKDCVIAHFGGPFQLTNTTFEHVRFACGGAADNTLNFLRLVRANGQNLLDELLNQGSQPQGVPSKATIN
jgi:hypothetical protein